MLPKKEIDRQVLHILLGLALAFLYYINILTPLAMFLGILCGLLLSFISKRVHVPIFSVFLEKLEREKYKKTFPGRGMILYFVGVLLSMQLFDKDIALASIMVLALGDSVSHLFGAKFGKIKNILNGDGKKLLEGTLAGTIVGFIGAALFVPIPEAFIGSLAAMVAEVIKIDFNDLTLDDNIIVPLVAGATMLLVRIYI